MRVRTFSDDDPVPYVAFELLPRCERAPGTIPGQTATLALEPDAKPLFQGRTDDLGLAQVELDLDDATPETVPLCARVVEPGYQQRVALGSASQATGESRPFLLSVRRGATARGRVVDATGRGLPATVSLSARSKGPDRSGFARSLADGWFELDLVESIQDGMLFADAGDAGSAVQEGVDLWLPTPRQDLRLQLQGTGVLRGRLVDRSGIAAGGVELQLKLALLDHDDGVVPAGSPASHGVLERRGRVSVELRTDEQGRFEAGGLYDSPFLVRAHRGPDTLHTYPHLLTPEPVAPGGPELRLTLTHPRVLVRLQDAEGEPLALPPNPSGNPAKEVRLLREGVPRVLAYACAPGAELDGDEAPLRGRRVGEAEVLFDVAGPTRVRVAAIGPGFDGTFQEVEVGQEDERVLVVLRAR